MDRPTAVLVTHRHRGLYEMPPSVRAYDPTRSSKRHPRGAAPGPPVKTGARVRRFQGCN